MSSIPAVHMIDGVRVEAMGAGATFANVNPATGEVLAEVPLDGGAAVDAAVASAVAAFPAWSQTPVGERCQVLFAYKQVLENHFDELTDLIVMEHGKIVPEARGDVRRGIDCIEYTGITDYPQSLVSVLALIRNSSTITARISSLESFK